MATSTRHLLDPRIITTFTAHEHNYRIIDIGIAMNLYVLQQAHPTIPDLWGDTTLGWFSPDAMLQLLATVIDDH